MMRLSTLLALCALCLGLWAQGTTRWLPQHEVEYFTRGSHSEVSNDSYYTYDAYGRVKVRKDLNLDAVDSLVYDYDELGHCTRILDYRGNSQTQGLFLYTDTRMEYDPILADYCTLTIGYQQVDQEWSLYKAEKIAILRDEEGRITRIADYTPGNDSVPDLPISYVKTFTYKGDRLDSYTHEIYQMDPVTEDVFLKTTERWTDIQWEEYEGQVTDMNECFVGHNRVKSARVYDDYYSYEYDLTVTYGESDPADFTATQNIVDAPLRKVHTLTITDANGSAVEEFRTYTLSDGGEATLTSRQVATTMYDDHHNLTLSEMALTADREHPEVVSTRMGHRYEYDYSPEYGDWTCRRDLLYNQSYVDGEEGYYEQTARIDRSDWALLDVSGIRTPLTLAPSQDAARYDLQGRTARAGQKGLLIEDRRATLRR